MISKLGIIFFHSLSLFLDFFFFLSFFLLLFAFRYHRRRSTLLIQYGFNFFLGSGNVSQCCGTQAAIGRSRDCVEMGWYAPLSPSSYPQQSSPATEEWRHWHQLQNWWVPHAGVVGSLWVLWLLAPPLRTRDLRGVRCALRP